VSLSLCHCVSSVSLWLAALLGLREVELCVTVTVSLCQECVSVSRSVSLCMSLCHGVSLWLAALLWLRRRACTSLCVRLFPHLLAELDDSRHGNLTRCEETRKFGKDLFCEEMWHSVSAV